MRNRVPRRWVAVAVVIVLLGAVVLVGGDGLGLGQSPDVQSILRSGLPNDTLVYDRTGTVLLADIQQPGSQHTDVPLSAMGRWLPAATVADVDPHFWSEPGVDVGRLGRSAWDTARGHSGGETGSSIVLRLIRLRRGSPAGVVERARTLALAVRVAGAVPRAHILESYLNSLPYGNRAVGVEAAAITYFQVDAGQLDLAQASLLAGLPDAPARLDPLRSPALAKQRQRQVLDAMVRAGVASRQEAEQAFKEPLPLVGPALLDVAPDVVHQALDELAARYGESATSRGFTVLATLDWGLQQQADRTVRQALAANRSRGATDAALAAVDPRTGQILALAVADKGGVPFALATSIPVNPGNAFRVFTYAAAIASGRYTMVTPIGDSPIRVDEGTGQSTSYHVVDYDLRDHGVCQVRDCLGNGLNIPAVLAEIGTGVPAVAQTARALGAPPFQVHGATNSYTTGAPDTSYGLSLTLGGYPETPLQMAAAMGTLAAGGLQRRPEAILRLSTRDRGTMYQAQPGPGQPALDPGAAFIVSQMLADDSNRALVYGRDSPLTLPGRHVAAAAGTSENFHDGWTIAYTPSLAAALWVGNTAGPSESLSYGSDGIVVAAPAWHDFMQTALDQLGEGDEWYAAPAGVQEATVNGRQAWFLPGTSAATPAPPMPASVHTG